MRLRPKNEAGTARRVTAARRAGHRGGGSCPCGRMRQQRLRTRCDQGGRGLPARQLLQHRLAEPVHRLPGRRLRNLRIRLSDARAVQPEAPMGARLRPELAGVPGRQDMDLPHPAQREVVGRKAAHRCRRRLDTQHHHEVPGGPDCQLGGLRRAHDVRGRPRTRPRWCSRTRGRLATCSRRCSRHPSCPRTSGPSTRWATARR